MRQRTRMAMHGLRKASSPRVRSQLEKSLKQRGIKVVRWSDDEKNPSRPLVFPPHWANGPSSGSVHCAVLLDFSDRR